MNKNVITAVVIGVVIGFMFMCIFLFSIVMLVPSKNDPTATVVTSTIELTNTVQPTHTIVPTPTNTPTPEPMNTITPIVIEEPEMVIDVMHVEQVFSRFGFQFSTGNPVNGEQNRVATKDTNLIQIIGNKTASFGFALMHNRDNSASVMLLEVFITSATGSEDNSILNWIVTSVSNSNPENSAVFGDFIVSYTTVGASDGTLLVVTVKVNE